MVTYSSDFEAIVKDFKNNKIPVETPGFYDHRNFINIEQFNRDYLNNYARFVQTRAYSDEYLRRARDVIPKIVTNLHEEVVGDKRLGLCADMSLFVSRILEQEGFWNYIVRGSLVIDFSKDSRIKTKYFWSEDMTPITGHAWVFAPPYNVIDLTLKQQYYTEGEEEYLPDYVVSDSEEKGKPEVKDIYSPERRLYEKMGNNISLSRIPTLKNFVDTFPTYIVRHEETRLKYIQCAITAPDNSFENMGLRINSRTAKDLYNSRIKGKL